MSNAEYQPIDPALVPRFADIATFMRTRRHEIREEVDIGLVGVPFDLGLNYRSGARQGPAGVREASRIIRRVHPSSGIEPFEHLQRRRPRRRARQPDEQGQVHRDDPGVLRGAAPPPHHAHRHRRRPHHPAADPARHRAGRSGRDPALSMRTPTPWTRSARTRSTTPPSCVAVTRKGSSTPKRVIQIGMRGSRFTAQDIQYGYDVGFRSSPWTSTRRWARGGHRENPRGARRRAGLRLARYRRARPGLSARDRGAGDRWHHAARRAGDPALAARASAIIGADISEVSPCFDPTGITCVTVANLMFELLCVAAFHKAGAERRRG